MKRRCEGMSLSETKGMSSSHSECFLVREGLPLRSLLPDDMPQDGGVVVTLSPGMSVEGIAGAGGAAIDGERRLGGWCSFRCELAVPRRFAARAGEKLAAGDAAEDVLRGLICSVMQRLLENAAEETERADLRFALGRRLREEAGRELLRMGWQLSGCRLENIQITRREDA